MRANQSKDLAFGNTSNLAKDNTIFAELQLEEDCSFPRFYFSFSKLLFIFVFPSSMSRKSVIGASKTKKKHVLEPWARPSGKNAKEKKCYRPQSKIERSQRMYNESIPCLSVKSAIRIRAIILHNQMKKKHFQSEAINPISTKRGNICPVIYRNDYPGGSTRSIDPK